MIGIIYIDIEANVVRSIHFNEEREYSRFSSEEAVVIVSLTRTGKHRLRSFRTLLRINYLAAYNRINGTLVGIVRGSFRTVGKQEEPINVVIDVGEGNTLMAPANAYRYVVREVV